MFYCLGSKIKELRARTGTYIKTPVRDEDPVFIITGRKGDIETAKQEILATANHFSQIRASRLYGSAGAKGDTNQDCVTIQVSVPYDVVGLVVGPKGATIKRIQQDTHTYIVTPSRDQKPVFQISGAAENVEEAKKEIKNYIWIRTGKSLPELNLNSISKQLTCNRYPSTFSKPNKLLETSSESASGTVAHSTCQLDYMQFSDQHLPLVDILKSVRRNMAKNAACSEDSPRSCCSQNALYEKGHHGSAESESIMSASPPGSPKCCYQCSRCSAITNNLAYSCPHGVICHSCMRNHWNSKSFCSGCYLEL